MSALKPPFQREEPPVVYGQQAQDETDALIGNMESFFPALSLKAFQARYRVDASQHEQRQRQCLRQAMINVNHELMDADAMPDGVSWVCGWVQKGYNALKDIPAPLYNWTEAQTVTDELTGGGVDDEQVLMSEKVFLYQSAVFANGKALLIQRYPELFFGKKNRNEKQDPDTNTSPDYWDEYRNSMHQLMETSLVTVELI